MAKDNGDSTHTNTHTHTETFCKMKLLTRYFVLICDHSMLLLLLCLLFFSCCIDCSSSPLAPPLSLAFAYNLDQISSLFALYNECSTQYVKHSYIVFIRSFKASGYVFVVISTFCLWNPWPLSHQAKIYRPVTILCVFFPLSQQFRACQQKMKGLTIS